jgi:hypothetical protein
MDSVPSSKACHQQIRLATNMKFAGVNIYGHPNIWCEVQHRLTTKNFFYLELKRNVLLAKEITICLPAPPMTNGNNYEKTFAFKIMFSHTTYHFDTTSDKIYMTNWSLKYSLNWLQQSWICNSGLSLRQDQHCIFLRICWWQVFQVGSESIKMYTKRTT